MMAPLKLQKKSDQSHTEYVYPAAIAFIRLSTSRISSLILLHQITSVLGRLYLSKELNPPLRNGKLSESSLNRSVREVSNASLTTESAILDLGQSMTYGSLNLISGTHLRS